MRQDEEGREADTAVAGPKRRTGHPSTAESRSVNEYERSRAAADRPATAAPRLSGSGAGEPARARSAGRRASRGPYAS